MVGDRNIGLDEESLIIYKNDDGEIIEAKVTILEIGSFVKFKTNSNTIFLPAQRVLKIKMRRDDGKY